MSTVSNNREINSFIFQGKIGSDFTNLKDVGYIA